MARMGYKNFREPVVYILDQELRKRNFRNQINTAPDNEKNIKLVEYPLRLIRDSNKRVTKCVYAENTKEEWSEELIRDSKGKVYQVKTTFPDGSSKTVEMHKDIEGKVENIDYV